jgi:hypothetical protein
MYVSPTRRAQITDRDRDVLELLAEHRVVVLPQIQHALGGASVPATESRLRRLQQAGLLVQERIFEGYPPAAWITGRGLGAIERRLPSPRVDLKGYRHDVGVAWLWLAAGDGCFGRAAGRYSEREMRSSDRRTDRSGRPFGVGLGMRGPRGGERLHYPDLLVVTDAGHRVAVELELTAKSRRRLDGIMLGYACDPRVDAIVYLCPTEAIGRGIADAARRCGISERVHVQRLAAGSPVGAPEPGRVSARAAGRKPQRAAGRKPQRAAGRKPQRAAGREPGRAAEQLPEERTR